MHEARVKIHDPFLQRRDSARLLRAQRAAVECLVERHDHIFRASAGFDTVRAAQLDGGLHGFRAGGQQEDFLQRRGQNGGQLFHQARADFTRKAIIREQTRVGLRRDGVHNLLPAMAGVGDQHPGGPIDPLVAPSIENLKAFGAIPDNGRLPAHCDRFVCVQALQYR